MKGWYIWRDGAGMIGREETEKYKSGDGWERWKESPSCSLKLDGDIHPCSYHPKFSPLPSRLLATFAGHNTAQLPWWRRVCQTKRLSANCSVSDTGRFWLPVSSHRPITVQQFARHYQILSTQWKILRAILCVWEGNSRQFQFGSLFVDLFISLLKQNRTSSTLSMREHTK